MKKLAIGIAAGGLLLGGSAVPIIPGPQEELVLSYEKAVYDTPTGELDVGYYTVFSDGSLYAHTRGTGPEQSQYKIIASPTGYKEAHQTGLRYESLFRNSGGTEETVAITPAKYRSMGEKNGVDHNPTRKELKSLLDVALHTDRAHAAIARDNQTVQVGSSGVTSITFSHTNNSTSNIIDIILGFTNVSGTVVTGATYDGNAATNIDDLAHANFGDNKNFYIVGQASGAKNVVISSASAVYIAGQVISYTGAKQTGQPDSHTTDTCPLAATTRTTSTTVVAANSWLVETLTSAASSGSYTAGAGTTIVNNSTGEGIMMMDSGGPVGTGSQSLVVNFSPAIAGSAPTCGILIISLAPAPATQTDGFFNEF